MLWKETHIFSRDWVDIATWPHPCWKCDGYTSTIPSLCHLQIPVIYSLKRLSVHYVSRTVLSTKNLPTNVISLSWSLNSTERVAVCCVLWFSVLLLCSCCYYLNPGPLSLSSNLLGSWTQFQCGLPPYHHQAMLETAAVLQHNSDPVYLEIASDFPGSVLPDCPHTHTSDASHMPRLYTDWLWIGSSNNPLHGFD